MFCCISRGKILRNRRVRSMQLYTIEYKKMVIRDPINFSKDIHSMAKELSSSVMNRGCLKIGIDIFGSIRDLGLKNFEMPTMLILENHRIDLN